LSEATGEAILSRGKCYKVRTLRLH
jgi:hypothetical protein